MIAAISISRYAIGDSVLYQDKVWRVVEISGCGSYKYVIDHGGKRVTMFEELLKPAPISNCPLCGADTSKFRYIDNLCGNCAIKTHGGEG